MFYLIGDVQGCCGALQRMLEVIDFSPSRDRAVVLGDLVNRGPDSLGTLRVLRDLGDSVSCLLGNHDLHLLAVSQGVRPAHRNDTLADILGAADGDAWIDWVRHRRLALQAHGWLLVHAGVAPGWTAQTTLEVAAEIEAQLQGPNLREFLAEMFGNQPARWSAKLKGSERLRFGINALTRIRFVNAEGRLDFDTKDATKTPPPGLIPWFDHPRRKTAGVPIAFGHWSTLGLVQRADLLSLDTGCVWGGALSAARLDESGHIEIIQIDCEQAQKPG